jgi:cytochrome c oxidase assembly protein subunit 15
MAESRRVVLFRFAAFAAGMTLLLILAGGFVTTTRTGDTIPTWPKSWGTMQAGWPVEWTHRAFAGVVGLLVAVLAFWARRPLAWAALGAVVVQALIGGLRISKAVPEVSIVHAVFGQVVFCAMVATAVSFSKAPRGAVPEAAGMGAAATAVAFLQLVAGAVTRHTGAGLHVHLAGAVAVLLFTSLFASRLMLTPLRRGAHLLLALLGAQIALGLATWAITASGFVRSPEAPFLQILTVSAHVALGALLLAASLTVTLLCRRPRGAVEVAVA